MDTFARYLALASLLVLTGCIDDGYRVSFDASTRDAETTTLADADVIGSDAAVSDAAPGDAVSVDASAFASADSGVADAALPADLVLVSSSPISAETNVALDASVHVVFSAELDPATVHGGSVWLQDDQGSEVPTDVLVQGASVTLQPTIMLAIDSAYSVYVTTEVADLFGTHLAAGVSWTFATVVDADTTPPQIVSTSPTSGSGDISVSPSVVVVFDERMNPATLNPQTILLEDSGGTPVAATVTATPTAAALTPNAALDPASTYTARVRTQVEDVAGNGLLTEEIWSFSTGELTDSTAPHVVTTNPQPDAEDIALSESIHAIFSETMDASSVNSSISLRDAFGNLVPTTISTSGSTATMLSVEGLRKEERYTARISASASDLAGNALGAEHNWTFSTPSRAWRDPELVENNNSGSVYGPSIAFDDTGTALATWRQWDGTRYNIWATRYGLGTGWGSPQLIETLSGEASSPSLAMTASGRAAAVWGQNDGTNWRIAANTYDPSTGWGAAELIDFDNGFPAQYPRVALDSAGGAIAVWEENDGSSTNVWWNRYTPSAGWGNATLMEPVDAGKVLGATIVPDGVGGLVACWSHHGNPAPTAISWTRHYVVGAGWQTPEVMVPYDPSKPFGHYEPAMAFDSSGNGIALIQGSGVQRMHYQPGAGWGPPERVWPNDGSFVRAPEIAITPSGDAMAIWVRDAGSGYDLWSEQYLEGIWQGAELVENEPGTLGYIDHSVAIDDRGNAIIMWATNGPDSALQTRRHAVDSGWDAAEELIKQVVQYTKVAIDGEGNAIALWTGISGGTGFNMWAARRD